MTRRAYILYTSQAPPLPIVCARFRLEVLLMLLLVVALFPVIVLNNTVIVIGL
jgi:hypothetical protein